MSLAKEIEAMLRGRGIPYILVEEAKKVLFGGAKLRAFDFVVYFPQGTNWLLCCGERRREKLADMQQWADIFGGGFKAVFAVRRAEGIKFMDSNGEAVALADDANASGIRRHSTEAGAEPRRAVASPSLPGPSPAAMQLSLFGSVV